MTDTHVFPSMQDKELKPIQIPPIRKLTRRIIGIDPGFSGALALLSDGKLTVYDMPTRPGRKGKTEMDPYALFAWLRQFQSCTVWLEKVGAMPGQGVSSTFRFGQGLGIIQGCVAAASHQIEWVTPQVWKKHFGLSAAKGAARGRASDMFPTYAELFRRVKDDGRAEATLIAVYGMQKSC